MKAFLFVSTLLAAVLCSSPAPAQRLAVSAPLANIRSGPGTSYEILWNTEKYYPLEILKKSGNWFRFRDFEGDEGWIHKSLVANTPTVITKAATCHIREGPGTSFKILFTVGRGIPFKTLDRRKRWLHIQHADGDRGWIHQSLVW